MEINPVLDGHGVAKPGLWYVLSPENDGPSPRVGHSCCVKKNSTKCSGEEGYVSQSLLIVGGANPDGAFDDAYILDFEKFSWQKCEWHGLPTRYEHTAFIAEHEHNEIVVFGGARKDNNLNDIQILDTEANSWCIALPSGKAPSQRTCHSAAAIGDELYIFGGGKSGAEPVDDNMLHVYNANKNSWSQPTICGTPPNCRHGHIMVVIKNNLYIHGGMAGTQIFDDLWQLQIDEDQMTWSQPAVTGEIPSKRAAHAGSAFGKNLYIFGGMNVSGALDDLFALNTESFVWQKIKCDGPPPSCRLDHTMCTVTVAREIDASEEKSKKVQQTFLVVFGGMDTRGEIFDDCLGFLLQD